MAGWVAGRLQSRFAAGIAVGATSVANALSRVAGEVAGANASWRPAMVAGTAPAANCAIAYQSFRRPRRRATAWLCSWQIRDSLTSMTAAISRKFMSCS